MTSTRIRVKTTEDGFRGRRAGTQFDLTPAEFAAGGPFEAVATRDPSSGGGQAPPVTAAAAAEADRAGVDLSAVAAGPSGRVTINEVRAAAGAAASDD